MPQISPRFSEKNLVLHDYARYFFLLAIVGVLSLFFWVISPFFNVLVYASLITVVFFPMNRWFRKKVKAHKGIAAFLNTLLVVLVVLTPLALFTIALAQQAIDAYNLLETKLVQLDVEQFILSGKLEDLPLVGDAWNGWVERYGVERFFGNAQFDLVTIIQDLSERISAFLVSQSATILRSVGDTIVSLFILLLTTFFFFRDGEALLEFFKTLSPLPTKYEDEIQRKLKDTTYAIVLGNFGTAVLQGFVGAIGFAIAGVGNVLFWGALMAFASLIPYVGAAFIWFPAAAAFFLQGQWGWGIFMLIWGAGGVSMVDNFARPYLIGTRTKIYALTTFLVVLGGIFMFGLKGIVFGPLILGLTVTIIHIYQLEYKAVLKR